MRGLAATGTLGSVAALVGCTSESGGSRPEADSATPPPTPTSAPTADDTALVEELRGRVSAAHAHVRAVRRSQPERAAALRGLERTHAEHAEALGGLIAVGPPGGQNDARRALAQLARTETRLIAALARGARSADSGALALLLASASAGLSQRLAAIDA